MDQQLNNEDLAKVDVEHKEPVNYGFFILREAKLWTLEVFYNSFSKVWDNSKLDEMEMDTDSRYPIVAEKRDSIWPELNEEWEKLWWNDCADNLTAEALGNFST